MGLILGTFAAAMAAIIGFFSAGAAAVSAFFPRSKKGFYGLMFKGGALQSDPFTWVPVSQRDGIDNARLIVDRMPFTTWPRGELITVPWTDQVIPLRRVTLDIEIDDELKQCALEVEITWGIIKSSPGTTNYAARAAITNNSKKDQEDLAKLGTLVAKECSGGLSIVIWKPGITWRDLNNAEFLHREINAAKYGFANGREEDEVISCREALRRMGVEIRKVSIISGAREAIQVLVDNGGKRHDSGSSPSSDKGVGLVKQLNGEVAPTLEATGVRLGIPIH